MLPLKMPLHVRITIKPVCINIKTNQFMLKSAGIKTMHFYVES